MNVFQNKSQGSRVGGGGGRASLAAYDSVLPALWVLVY